MYPLLFLHVNFFSLFVYAVKVYLGIFFIKSRLRIIITKGHTPLFMSNKEDIYVHVEDTCL